MTFWHNIFMSCICTRVLSNCVLMKVLEQMETTQAHIAFKPKGEKIVETILHLTHRVENLTRYKCAKLVYLADKEHLNRYNRPITFDTYVALESGPVPSVTYDLTKGETKAKKYSSKIVKLPFSVKKCRSDHKISNPTRQINRKIFSISDIRVLDEIIDEFAGKNCSELRELTHRHDAWKNAWKNKKTSAKSGNILFEDMIEDSANKEDLVEMLRFLAPAVF